MAASLNLTYPRYSLAAAAALNFIFFAGGDDGAFRYDSTSMATFVQYQMSLTLVAVDVYNVTSGQLENYGAAHPSLNASRYDLAGAALATKIFFAGGTDETGVRSDGMIHSYDSSPKQITCRTLVYILVRHVYSDRTIRSLRKQFIIQCYLPVLCRSLTAAVVDCFDVSVFPFGHTILHLQQARAELVAVPVGSMVFFCRRQ